MDHTFFDETLVGIAKALDSPWPPPDSVLNCPHVHIDNIGEFYWHNQKQVFDIATDIPNMAPPWPMAWFQYTMPKQLRTEDGWMIPPNRQTIGGLVSAYEVDESMGHKWELTTMLSLTQPGLPTVAMCAYTIYLDRWGKFCGSILGPESIAMMILQEKLRNHPQGPELAQGGIDHLKVILLAISFLHCKNVELVKHSTPPKLARALEKRGRPPRHEHHTLTIDPMMKVLRNEGGMGRGNSAQKALHIVRGHFADYRERGLFGRNHDIFWFDQHVRGTKHAGVITKDYEVRAPMVELERHEGHL